MFKTIILGASGLCLTACVSLLPKGEDLEARLGLDPGWGAEVSAAPLGVTLSVADPRAEDVFDTPNVAVLTGPLQYEYLSGAEWTDRAPILLGLFLERRLGGTDAFTAVGDRVALPVADYTLHTDIRALNLDVTSGRSANVAFGARLTNRRNETLGTRVFRANTPVDGNANGAAAGALNEAAAQLTDQTFDWMRPLIEADIEAQATREAARRTRRGA